MITVKLECQDCPTSHQNQHSYQYHLLWWDLDFAHLNRKKFSITASRPEKLGNIKKHQLLEGLILLPQMLSCQWTFPDFEGERRPRPAGDNEEEESSRDLPSPLWCRCVQLVTPSRLLQAGRCRMSHLPADWAMCLGSVRCEGSMPHAFSNPAFSHGKFTG